MRFRRGKMLTSKQLFLLIIVAAVVVISCAFYWILFTEFRSNRLADGAALRSAAGGPSSSLALSAPATYDFDQNLVVIYNRVPKTGSTSFVNIAYDLCKRNKYHVLHINVTANMHVLSLPNQVSFVRNVTGWNAMKPALYHGHMAFLDFSRFQMPFKPIYINLVRKPLDRLVSYYYFLRYGDNYRPNLVRKKAGNKMTFDECVEEKQPDCDPKNMWLQIPFFCGHAAECWDPGSEWALNQAKQNLVNEYFLVGVTEEMEDFIDLLEKSLPRLFKGFKEHYQHSNKSHLRQTSSKIPPSDETIAAIKQSKIWKMENELYEFALKQFQFTRKKLTIPDKNKLQTFMYEKIRPK